MNTPDASQTGGTSTRGNKPDLYHGDRNKLEAWILQVDRYFHLEGDKIDDKDKVVLATTYFRGDAEKWANPIIRRYMDPSDEDQDNIDLVSEWDTFKTKLRQVFSPFKESVVAEQKIQKLKQIRSAADYTTEFQQYSTAISWDNNALMRMYRQGLKPTVRRELMRSGTRLDTLEDLMNESIRLDNELYELALEERLFNQGTRAPVVTNTRPRHQPRRSYPNQGRQRSYQPRVPGAYATNGYEPMHLDNINKGPGKPKFQHDKSKKITCYACGKEGHMARDCRSKNKVTRQLNVLRKDGNDSDEAWNVITRPTVQRQVANKDAILDGLEHLTLTTQEYRDDSLVSDEEYETPEEDKPPHTKHEKMATFKEKHRPSTPYAGLLETEQLSLQINSMLCYLNKNPVNYATETPNMLQTMRQHFYELACEVDQDKENVPPEIKKFLPTPSDLQWIKQAVCAWENLPVEEDGWTVKIPEEDIQEYENNKPSWAKEAEEQWVQSQKDNKRKINQMSQDTTVWYWYDPRNPKHAKLSWTACTHEYCRTHYSEKQGSAWSPRRVHGFPKCKWQWFECTKDVCPKHLWDKRERAHFPGHEDPQDIIQMQTVYETRYVDNSTYECKEHDWQTCLSDTCDKHRDTKEFHGFGTESFLDQRTATKAQPRRSTQ